MPHPHCWSLTVRQLDRATSSRALLVLPVFIQQGAYSRILFESVKLVHPPADVRYRKVNQALLKRRLLPAVHRMALGLYFLFEQNLSDMRCSGLGSQM